MKSRRFASRSLLLPAVLLPALVAASNAAEPPAKPYPGGKKADIWVLAGQSNMQGVALLKAPIPTDPRVMVFTREEKWELAEEPLDKEVGVHAAGGKLKRNFHLQRGGVGLPTGTDLDQFLRDTEARGKTLIGVSPGLAFAKHLLTAIDRPLGLLFTPYAGTSMDHWDPAGSDKNFKLYSIMMRRIKMVGGKIKGVLWYQGEAEGNDQAARAYEAKLLNFIDCLRRDVGDPELPVIYAQIGRMSVPPGSNGAPWERVRESQRRVARQRKNVYVVSAIDLPLDDFIHVSYEGQLRLGRRFAEVALSEVYRVPGHGKPIDLDSIEVLQPESLYPLVRVRFRNVSGKLRAPGEPRGFELRAAGGQTERVCTVYRVDFDPTDPAALVLGVYPWLKGPYKLIYAPGYNPCVSITDEKDMPLPAFGPVDLPAAASQPKK